MANAKLTVKKRAPPTKRRAKAQGSRRHRAKWLRLGPIRPCEAIMWSAFMRPRANPASGIALLSSNPEFGSRYGPTNADQGHHGQKHQKILNGGIAQCRGQVSFAEANQIQENNVLDSLLF
jgi:hypothetical protein